MFGFCWGFFGEKWRLNELYCAGRGKQLMVMEVQGLGDLHELRIQENQF